MTDFLSSLKIAASGLHAQNARMRVIAENLANADSAGKTPTDQPYRRRIPTFQAIMDNDAGGEVVLSKPFPDHHFYAEDELAELAATARTEGLGLITTAKDAARLRHGAPQGFLEGLDVLEIDTVFELGRVPERIIEERLDAARNRKLRG